MAILVKFRSGNRQQVVPEYIQAVKHKHSYVAPDAAKYVQKSQSSEISLVLREANGMKAVGQVCSCDKAQEVVCVVADEVENPNVPAVAETHSPGFDAQSIEWR